MISRNSFTRALLMALVLTSSSLAFSQSTPPEKWPTRPIKMIIPFSAGGPLDSLARKFGQNSSGSHHEHVQQ